MRYSICEVRVRQPGVKKRKSIIRTLVWILKMNRVTGEVIERTELDMDDGFQYGCSTWYDAGVLKLEKNARISLKHWRVLHYLAIKMDVRNHTVLSTKDIATAFDVGETYAYKMMGDLIAAGAVGRHNSCFTVSPELVWRGRFRQREILLESIKAGLNPEYSLLKDD